MDLKDRSGEGIPQSRVDRPVILTDENFEEKLAKSSLMAIDFWAPWCGPCHMIAPIIERLAKDYAGSIVFGKLNVDENPDTSMKFGIMSIPTLIIFKDGKPIDKIVGALPKAVLEDRIRGYLPG